MKTRLPFILSLLLILSTGCGTMPGYNGGGGGASAGRFVWYKEGATTEQTQRDLAEARMKTIQLRPLSAPPAPHRAPAPGQYDTTAVYDGLAL